MDSFVTLVVLRAIHILAGAFWVGAVFFTSLFLIPSLRGAGPAAGGVMQQLVQVRRLPLWVMSATVLTILSGIGLYWRDSAGFTSAWLGSGQGRVFGLGAVLSIVGAVVGMGVNAPAGRRMTAIAEQAKAAGRPPTAGETAEMQRLQTRMATAGQFVAVLLLFATLAMAVARYVP
jgi:uncharacterized membrane protein